MFFEGTIVRSDIALLLDAFFYSYFAKDRQYTLIYDGNASTDYETIGARLIMQKLFELFFAILNAHSNMCTQGNIVQFLLKRVRTIGC